MASGLEAGGHAPYNDSPVEVGNAAGGLIWSTSARQHGPSQADGGHACADMVGQRNRLVGLDE